ncbi:hypothetical protein SAMN02982929_06506 [Saccharopolyspora kobensis]|uniref:DUF4386 family protein n=1 Tax=Saccharopolyspora kobensis TaxID=146035 RepID=A0A1H6EFU4_9PSEU|nr:hypothetical protein [Saccharopolyspora kobensis]SEG96642.1 hypothetical protein SAMN02982929_06506 [Saccharopolyspora kobensis]SFF05163.1 hypothetical protein SAMN05216506_11842 [Saccharopolyspora kobensis]
MAEPIAVQDLLLNLRSRRVAFSRAGAVCGLVGTLGYLVAFLLHGDLPDQTTESLLTFIADRPWALHHLAIVFCLLLWVAALAGLAHSLSGGIAWVLGRMGQGVAMLGMAVLLWHYNIDGPALEGLADAWIRAEGAEKAVLLERATILVAATSGMFPLYVALLLGLPFLLFGLALVKSEGHPSWLGWTGAAAGAIAFAVGVANFTGFDVLPMNAFVVSVFLLDLWMLAVARNLWRDAARWSMPAQ